MNGPNMRISGGAALAFALASVASAQASLHPAGWSTAKVKAAEGNGEQAGSRWTLGPMAWRASPLPGRRQILFRAGRARVVNRYRAHEIHFEQETPAGLFTIDTLRTRPPVGTERGGPPTAKFAVWSADAGYLLALNRHEILRLGMAMIAEKRGSLVAMTNPAWVRSTTRTIGMEWRREGRADLSFGQFQTGASRGATAAERYVQLAAGAPIGEHGFYGSIQLPLPAAPRWHPVIGMNMTSAHLDPADAAILGAAGAQDRRATISLSLCF